MPVFYFSEDIDFQLPSEGQHTTWIESILSTHQLKSGEINYIFCSDEYLLDINQEHLNHDYYTDIITFDLSEEDNIIDTDIFISVDRVRENAKSSAITFIDELHRVMAHGILHCIGFKDKTKKDQEEMREKEDSCLSLRKFI